MFDPVQPLPFDPQLAWRYIPVRCGETERGWLAGPPVGVLTHHTKHTKPCRSALTKGVLPCPFGVTCVPRFVMYVPYWSMLDEEKRVVMVSRGTALGFPGWTKDRVGCPVMFARPKKANNPPLKVSWEGGYDWPDRMTTKMKRRPPQDIRPYLLHLWQDEQLCRACGAEFIPSKASGEAAAVAHANNGKMGS